MPYRCTFHDEPIPGPHCPHGCSPAAVEELQETAPEVDEVPWVTWTGEQPARHTTPIVPKRKRLRDAKGRMLPDPVTAVHPDQQMTVEAIVLSIRQLWESTPLGGRTSLTIALGLLHRQASLIASGNEKAISMITSGVQRRISSALTRILSGEVQLKQISPPGAKYPRYAYTNARPRVDVQSQHAE